MTDFTYPEWLKAYQEAELEPDDAQLLSRVAHAEAAIYCRFQAIAGDPDHHAERQALNEATSGLRNLQTKRLKFPE